MTKQIPVILDTDIGGDIDDAWALAMLLKSPELDLKLLVTDTGNTEYRAAVAAKLLEAGGRTDVPIGVGVPQGEGTGPQEAWLGDYTLEQYAGPVIEDGVGAMIDTIMESPEPITLICIGPVPNIAVALEREPRIAENARFVGMHGSVRKGYGGGDEVSAEYNVAADPAACRRAFAAPWEVTITPLDTCGIVQLTGEAYQKVLACDDALIEALIESYRSWTNYMDWEEPPNADVESSTLFDTVAVYLAFSDELLTIEELGIHVTSDGYTHIDQEAPRVRCATEWKDLEAFKDLLVQRLTES